MKIEKITIVTPSLPYANLVSRTVMVEYGVPMIATVVRNAGYDVKLYAEHIAPIDWRRVMESDLVCFHAFSSTMPKVIQHTARVREQRPDMPIIIGGVHASVMAEDTLQYCDFVVRQEGDETLPELLDVLKNDGDVSNVLGISYMVNGEFRHNPNRPFVQDFNTIPDMELVEGYMSWMNSFKLLRHRRIVWNVLQTSRGCPFDCSFCIAPSELGRGYRMRDIETVVADIKYQRELTGRRRFFLVDNHFTVNRERTKALMQRIIEEDIDWEGICFTRVEVARDTELLRLMRRAGMRTLYIGVESFNDTILKLLNKKAPREGTIQSIRAIKAEGLRVLGSFVLGTDAETVESIRATIDNAIDLELDLVALFPLSAYPEENGRMLPLNRFLLPDWGRLDGTFVIFLPKNMKPSTLQREIIRAFRKFYGIGQVADRLLVKKDPEGALWKAFYGYRIREIIRDTSKWIEYLESVEDHYYDENEQLIEERLGEGLVPCKYLGSSRRAGMETAAIGV